MPEPTEPIHVATLVTYEQQLIHGEPATATDTEIAQAIRSVLAERDTLRTELAAPPALDVDSDAAGRIVVTVTGRGEKVAGILPRALSGNVVMRALQRLAGLEG